MKPVVGILAVVVATAPIRAEAAPPDSRIAVLQPESDGLPRAVQEQLASTIESGASRTGADVLSAADASKLDEGAAKCAASSCAAEAAGKLGVGYVMLTSIVTEGRDHTINMELSDGSGTILSTVNELCEICGQEELLDMVEEAATRIAETIRSAGVPATLAVSSKPNAAQVRIDGATVGNTPLEMEVAPGDHDLVISKDGYLDYTDRIRATKGVRFPVEVNLRKAPDKLRERATARKIGFAAIGVGAASAIAGAVLVAMHGRPITGNCSGENIDADGDCKFVYTTMVGGIGALAGGVAALGTGVGLVVWSKKEPQSNARSYGVGMRLRF